MKRKTTPKELRTFGLLIGGIFLVIAVWPMMLRSETPRLWALGLGASLVCLGAVVPRSLTHVHFAWMKAGELLGWINSRILLGVVFYGLITPMGLLMRLSGKDPMRLVSADGPDTYRVIRKPRPRDHMKNQF
jgi:Saxitoxin biosynthesis operon protein SxtJ